MMKPSIEHAISLKQWIDDRAEPFDKVEEIDLEPLMERVGDSRIVMIGEASHGTSEFYRIRQRITAELIEQKDFKRIGIEGDWPDVERVDEYVRGREPKPARARVAFHRFPDWMWRNREFLEFVNWLERHNQGHSYPSDRVGIHGLDLYSLYSSIHEVMEFLERHGDPEKSEAARAHYASLLAYEPEAQNYGQAVNFGLEQSQSAEVLSVLNDFLKERLKAIKQERELVFDAEQNARVVANAEKYYRSIFRPGRESWNLRDSHMFETMQNLMDLADGDNGKMVVWAHNTHIGDARYTEMGDRGEHNIGQLAREAYEDDIYSIGFGTYSGTVAAADDWGQPVEIKTVRPSMEDSYERLCHLSGKGNYLLPLREARTSGIGREAKYERAIGVIYRPLTEFASHYFKADLPGQFDEYIWLDGSSAVTLIAKDQAPELPKNHPFAIID